MRKEDIIIGTPVIYWGIIKDNGERYDPKKTVIISEPWKLGHGQLVCKIKGISGGVDLEHLEPITPGSLTAAKLAGCKGITDRTIARAAEQMLAKNGVRTKVQVKTSGGRQK
jgi:hypothetical protein